MVPALRLLPEEPRWRGGAHENDAAGESPRIMIVAAQARRRAAIHRELAAALAPETAFAHAGNVWEVLAQAPRCGVVMLAGALPDVSVRTLSELLGRRHPWLPIVVLDAPEAQAVTGEEPI